MSTNRTETPRSADARSRPACQPACKSCSVPRVPGRRGGSLMDGRAAWQPTRRELLRAAAVAGAGIALPGLLARGALAARSASYDDGTGSIPGGLDGAPERVIIVGAGWAGLTAANALR